MVLSITDHSDVLVHFILTLADGSIADSSRQQGKPALFRLSDDSLSAALKQQLIGLSAGDKKNFTLPPQEAFGAVNPDLIQYFSRREFLDTGELVPGTVMLFSGINGSEMPGVIRDITGESVTVDFNHPLAGQRIQFDIEILEVDPPLESANADITG